jgi:hypothetical protein
MVTRKKSTIKVLSESHVAEAFEVVAGFNYPDGKNGEKRVNAGKTKPTIVFEKDFEPEVWEALIRLEAVKQIAPEEPLKEGENIAAEVIG